MNHPTYKSWTLTKDDADTTTTFAHGFTAGTPDAVYVVSTLQPDTTTDIIGWSVTVDSVNLTLMSAGNAGSGGTTPGTTVVAKVTAWLPHSIN